MLLNLYLSQLAECVDSLTLTEANCEDSYSLPAEGEIKLIFKSEEAEPQQGKRLNEKCQSAFYIRAQRAKGA